VWCDLPFGNDTIYAQDGEPDSISCGFGQDTVYADAVDVVDGDCETVIRGSGAPGGAGGGGTTSTPPVAHRPQLVRLKVHGRSLVVTARHAVTVRVAVRHGRTVTRALHAGKATFRLPRGRHRVTVTALGAHGETGAQRSLTAVVRA
jgi:hypothetical protein